WRSRSTAPHVEIPAMFMTTSTLPWSGWTSRAKARTAALSVTSSARWASTASPSSAAAAASGSAWMSVSTRRAPRRAAAWAVARLEDLPHNREEATAVARDYGERLTRAFAVPFTAGSATFELTASTGVALFPWHAEDTTELIAQADSAMYEAKRAGRARIAVF